MNRRTPQAQRKFAQVTPAGPVMPAAVGGPGVAVPSRARPPPREREERRKESIVFSNMNVHQLLDLLSFQCLKKPVKKTVRQPIINLTKCDVKPSQPDCDVKKVPEDSDKKPLKLIAKEESHVKEECLVKKVGKALTEGNMNLRNRSFKTFVKTSPPQNKHKKEDVTPENSPVCSPKVTRGTNRTISKRKVNVEKNDKDKQRVCKQLKMTKKISISDYSSEDETPLKFIPRNSVDRVPSQNNDGQITNTSKHEGSLPCKNNSVELKSAEVKLRKNIARTRIKRTLSEMPFHEKIADAPDFTKNMRSKRTCSETTTERTNKEVISKRISRQSGTSEMSPNRSLHKNISDESNFIAKTRNRQSISGSVTEGTSNKEVSSKKVSLDTISEKIICKNTRTNRRSSEVTVEEKTSSKDHLVKHSVNEKKEPKVIKKTTNKRTSLDKIQKEPSSLKKSLFKKSTVRKVTQNTTSDKGTLKKISSEKKVVSMVSSSELMLSKNTLNKKSSTENITITNTSEELTSRKKSFEESTQNQKGSTAKIGTETILDRISTTSVKTSAKTTSNFNSDQLTQSKKPSTKNINIEKNSVNIEQSEKLSIAKKSGEAATSTPTVILGGQSKSIETTSSCNSIQMTPHNITSNENAPGDISPAEYSVTKTLSNESACHKMPLSEVLSTRNLALTPTGSLSNPSVKRTVPQSLRSEQLSIDSPSSSLHISSQKSETQAVVAYYSLEAATSDAMKPVKEEIDKTENPEEVYEFHSESECEPPPELSFKRRKSTVVINEPIETTKYWKTGLVDYVIEEKAIKLPGREERVRHCKLILKSEMDPKQTIDVEEWKGPPLMTSGTTEKTSIQESLNAPQKLAENASSSKCQVKPVCIEAEAARIDSRKEVEQKTESGVAKKKQKTSESTNKDDQTPIQPLNKTEFPKLNHAPCLVAAPEFHPTEAEFKDPLDYIERITPMASKFGICKIVPPKGPQINCNLPDEIKFSAYNQYLHRMYQRWGPATKEVCAVKKYSAEHAVSFERAPLIDGVEVNLPLLFRAVQDNGGLKEVMDKGKWAKVAQELKLPNINKRLCTKLDNLYVKYLLPYDMLSPSGRQELFTSVEQEWCKKYKRMVLRACSPTHRQRRALRPSASSESEDDSVERALDECEDCVTRGRTMTLTYFKNVASVVKQIHFPGDPDRQLAPSEVEREYWKYVLMRTQHVCVYTAAVDSGEAGLGFPKPRHGKQQQPAWNLKVVSQSAGSVLRSLGSVLGVNVPTVHMGMVFSTTCWNRDPHGLPWIEYHHTGTPKIWYGIPDEQSQKFKKAVETLAPSFCQKKTIWLPSDVLMLPPSLLTEHGVSLSNTVQHPGEFVVVFPKAYTSSICTGYTVSESVYFGPKDWLTTVQQDFQEAQESCEPTMFPLEQLLLSVATDLRASRPVLLQVYSTLKTLLDDEKRNRKEIAGFKIKSVEEEMPVKSRKRCWSMRYDTEECDVCRTSLYLSKVTGLSGKNSYMCLKHAVTLLNQKACRQRVILKEVTLVCRLSDAELDTALTQLEARLFPFTKRR